MILPSNPNHIIPPGAPYLGPRPNPGEAVTDTSDNEGGAKEVEDEEEVDDNEVDDNEVDDNEATLVGFRRIFAR